MLVLHDVVNHCVTLHDGVAGNLHDDGLCVHRESAKSDGYEGPCPASVCSGSERIWQGG